MDILDLQDQVLGAYEGIEQLSPIEDPTLRIMTKERGWGRMVNEYGSSFVFSQFAEQCRQHQTLQIPNKPSVDRLREFAVEERRHGILCGAVVGIWRLRQCSCFSKSSFPLHEDASPLEGILRNLLSICCLAKQLPLR